VELHTHSTASDGELEPERVAELVAERNVDVWALTDHDNCGGCARARGAAEREGVEFLPGIEVSAYLERSVHVLGYGVDPGSSAIRELSEELYEARRDRMIEMLEQLGGMGVDLDFAYLKSLADGSPLSRSHLSRALVDRGPADSRDEAFERFIGTEAPAYVPVGWPSVPEAIEYIHAAGGAAVLAHPGRYSIDSYIPGWVDAGLDGLEIEHPDHAPEEEARYAELADELGLVATKGSDFHGRPRESWDEFGSIEISSETFRALRRSIQRHR